MHHRFDAPVLRTESGLINHYLPVPDEVAAAFRQAGIRRVLATLNGRTYRRAITGRRDGGGCLIVGEGLLREIGAVFGDMVTVELERDPHPDAVDLPGELTAVLEEDDAAAARFYAMTPGRQRSLALYITTAKRSDTRIRRALELAHKLRTHTLAGDRQV